ncbi:FlgB family protein [Pseudooceanicola onchidii]|uniref:FlgB family protein n=1 Tax=Pseudooceanicola onchidii TaxID=2562279 RepID=UPI0010AAE602|nr:FlgB family protein [Pseudooceanicola onchidii]
MFKSIDVLRMASAMASHAGKRQGVIAANMANADTPGYRARDVTPFTEMYRSKGATRMQATRAGHMFGGGSTSQPDVIFADSSDSSPNGNTVSLEEQMLNGVEVRKQHDRALAIYRNGMTVLRASLGRR